MPKHFLVWDHTKNAVSTEVIYREDDQAWIPTDPANVDYQAYLRWVDEGNQPEPPKNVPKTEQINE